MSDKVRFLYRKFGGWPDLVAMSVMMFVTVGIPWIVAYKFSDKWFYHFYGEKATAIVIEKPDTTYIEVKNCSRYSCGYPTHRIEAIIPIEYETMDNQIIQSVITLDDYEEYPSYSKGDTLDVLYLNYNPQKAMDILCYEKSNFWVSIVSLLIGFYFLYSIGGWLIEQFKKDLKEYYLKTESIE